MELPPGFQLDDPKKHQPAGLPAGFVLDGPEVAKATNQAPEQQQEANPWASRIMAFATGADDAMLNLPSNAAAALRTLTHGQSYQDAYDTIKRAGEQATQNHGLAYGAGVFGGIGATLPLMPEAAATVGGRAAQAAAMGAGMGGVSEFADSKDVGAALKAAAIGGAMGGVASPGIDAAAYAAGKVAQPVANTVRGLINPDDEASRRVAAAINNDRRLGAGGLTVPEYNNAVDAGLPVVVADLGGQTTQSLARSAANTSPEARVALDRAVERFKGQGQRISDTVDGFSTGISNFDKQEQLKQAAQAANRPAYAKAYAEGANGVWNEDLANLATAPAVRAAIKEAETRAANNAPVGGFDRVKNPFVEAADGTMSLRQGPNGETALPNLRFWDVVKQGLDAQIGAAKRAGDPGVRDLMGLKTALVEQLDAASPSYQAARSGAAQFFGANDAIEAGAKFVTAKGENAQFAAAIGKLSAPERKLFADGFATELVNSVSSIAENRDATINKIFNSPKSLERIRMALGPEKAKELEATLHIEKVMDGLRSAVKGNSTTARQLAEMGLAGGAAGAYLGNGDPSSISMGAAFAAAARMGVTKIDARVAQRVGEMLSSQDPLAVQKVTKMAAKNPRIMDFFRKFQTAAASGAGRVAGDYLGGR